MSGKLLLSVDRLRRTWVYRFSAERAKGVLAYSYKRRNAGEAAYIDPSVQVLGWRSVRIGRNAVISEGVWLNVNHRSACRTQIEIEDNCFIGRRNLLSSGHSIRIKSYCLTAVDCKFLGSKHVYDDPFAPYATTGTSDSDVIDVGVNCWFGANACVIGDARIGHGSVIGANSVVRGDVPPFSLVVGAPARVVKRYDPVERRWAPIDEYDSGRAEDLPSEAEYLWLLRAAAPRVDVPLSAASCRFGDLP